MPQKFHNKKGEPIVLSDKPFANPGGEGAIYVVIEPIGENLVAKIYHNQEIANSRKDKLEFMYTNDPTETASEEIKRAIVWVEDLLYKEGEFVGFAMQKIENAIPLKSLTLARNPSKSHGEKWRKFDHNQIGSHHKRLVIAYNLSQAVNAIHERGNYVIIDMKPQNIFVREDASISIIDLDSIQIKNEAQNFPAKVFTEEYAPPEKHLDLVDHQNGNISEEWDYFSLAVIIYELLFSIHPYQASHKSLTTRPELIKAGYFVHGKRQKALYKIPFVHSNYKKIPFEIQNLFNNTFDRGHQIAKSRINPLMWSNVLLQSIKQTGLPEVVIDLKPNVVPPSDRNSNHKVSPKNEEESNRSNEILEAVIPFSILFFLVLVLKLPTFLGLFIMWFTFIGLGLFFRKKISIEAYLKLVIPILLMISLGFYFHELQKNATNQIPPSEYQNEQPLNTNAENEETINDNLENIYPMGYLISYVRELEGVPERTEDNLDGSTIWYYGGSKVVFANGQVIEHNFVGGKPIKETKIDHSSDNSYPMDYLSSYIKKVEGGPDDTETNWDGSVVWYYGGSKVVFSYGKVIDHTFVDGKPIKKK